MIDNSTLDDLIYKMEGIFFKKGTETLEYSDKEQKIINENLTKIAHIIGCFKTQTKKERGNIEEDLTIIDTKTGKRIELVDTSSMQQRVEGVLQNNDMYSVLRCLALSNKCAHEFLNKCNSISSLIEKYKDKLGEQKNTENSHESYDMSNISSYHIDKLIDTLNSNTSDRGQIIGAFRTLNIDIKDIKTDESKLIKKFEELKKQKDSIIGEYIEKLTKELTKTNEYEKSLFWIKDQFIGMIGQLLVKDDRYQELEYEMVRCGTKGFENMLSINYPELSYYIEVHMPDFVSDTLIKEYKLKEPVNSNERKFERLGASAVYERDDSEIDEIKESELDNTRARILSRPKKSNIGSACYAFHTNKIQLKEDVGILEEYLRNGVKDEYYYEIIKRYSFLRSDQGERNIEERIIADSIDEVIAKIEESRESSDLKAPNIIEDIKNFARQKLLKGNELDKIYLMFIEKAKKTAEVIKLIGYEKVIRDSYENEASIPMNSVRIIEFIGDKYKEIDERIEGYRRYKTKSETHSENKMKDKETGDEDDER